MTFIFASLFHLVNRPVELILLEYSTRKCLISEIRNQFVDRIECEFGWSANEPFETALSQNRDLACRKPVVVAVNSRTRSHSRANRASLVMNNTDCPIIFFPGAGGGMPDLSVFRAGPDVATRFVPISYPGWQRYVVDGFATEMLIAELAQEVSTKVPHGPIWIVGMSIGGHFGYAVALYLQARDREIAGFCAIDSEMFTSSAPSEGWIGRALGEVIELLRQRRFTELNRFVRSRIWRALLRSTRGLLPKLLRRFSSVSSSAPGAAINPLFEEELSMRLLIRDAAPWLASIDREPVALRVPSALLRCREAAGSDTAWRRRCPNIEIFEVSGEHHTLFGSENVGSLHEAFIAATCHWRGGGGDSVRGEAFVGQWCDRAE